ncbi:MAG: 2-C-methyl-D-erythritol 2,4-cyclodiphosphate synthase [Oscillospiraceae bacterium]|nr:2-C-methyl-D-erythritol 2,4-cyclodiphosphate synthase [Oscillospiraceae bacterium]
MRIGLGYDVHRLKSGRKFILCGVEIPCDFGPDGHSDADVALHALMDAMLGALAMGDIGMHFPDSDVQWQDADSVQLLKHIYSLVHQRGYTLGNADITVVLQSPRIASFIEDMRNKIALTIDVDVSKISVKATTEEKLGFTGSGDGVSAHAVVLLEQV